MDCWNLLKQYILDNLHLKTGITFRSRYARLFNPQYSNNLNNPHIICLKSSGTPYLLFCTQINDTNYCFLIDKKVKDEYEHPKIFIVHFLLLSCSGISPDQYFLHFFAQKVGESA